MNFQWKFQSFVGFKITWHLWDIGYAMQEHLYECILVLMCALAVYVCVYVHVRACAVQVFFSSLEECGSRVDPGLVKRGLQFRDNLTKKFKWDFSSEPDDFAPTVVELT